MTSKDSNFPHLSACGYPFVSVHQVTLGGHEYLGIVEEPDFDQMLAELEAGRVPVTLIIWVEEVHGSLLTASDELVNVLNQGCIYSINNILKRVS